MKNLKKVLIGGLILSLLVLGGVAIVNYDTPASEDVLAIDPPLHPW